MRRYAEGTPCPAPSASSSTNFYSEYGTRSSMYAPAYSTDDTTANIEYTTELQADLRKAKPRRPIRSMRKPTFNPTMDIFEDVAQEEQQQQGQIVDTKRRSRASVISQGIEKKSSILAHPAQRIPVAAPAVQQPQPPKTYQRRVSQMPTEREDAEINATVQLHESMLEKKELRRRGPKKDPRRRTIYVPSDDTTIVTIHPGQSTHVPRNPRQKSPDLGLELVTLSEEEPNNLVSALKKEKKAPRKSLAVPPKRGPLQQSTRSLQSATFSEDAFGKGGGKENVPPGWEISLNFGKDEAQKPASKPACVHFNTSKTSAPAVQARTKSVETQKRLRSQLSYDGSPAKSIKAKVDATATTTRTTTTRPSIKAVIKDHLAKSERAPLSSSPFHTDRSPPTALRRQRSERAPTKITMMHEVGKPKESVKKYPVLTEDLARPELYEDHWLTYQEVAITQLLNSLFDSSGSDSSCEQTSEDLRKEMLALYQDTSIPLLHKRLQASLSYGALSIPKDLLAQMLRLKDDVGLRKKFLNMWVKTYDLSCLRAAAETVVGRQITVPCRLSSGSTSSDDGSRQFRTERRAIEAFLDTFLIRNEDAIRVKAGAGSIASIARGDHHGEDFGSQGWSWRRTVLRSLMLILLLDKAKTTDIFAGCLFQTSSPHKTSADVLHFLANMLLPSAGDITRPLGHLNYKVEHAQYPLQEYTYHIENIAIDLRDGVILTRLVELLLYPPSKIAARGDETIAITMSNGELLTSAFDYAQKESWVLSQHLKFPSIGRAQKLYNVEIALAALNGIQEMRNEAVGGVKAQDVVDGHREKTLSLLWALVGKCGLNTLVDWGQVVKEIERLRDAWYSSRDNCAQHHLDSDDDEDTAELTGFEYHKRLLLSWSRSIARLRGLRVSNLTTSFSNPRILEAIVDTYLPSSLLGTSSKQLSLAAKLKATGCSTSFISLFATQNTSQSIPSKDFTLLALSFLASRLLPLSVTHRAAATIQRAYRLRLARQTVHKRVVLMRVAAACAVVAMQREKLVQATMLVQRRWKAIQTARSQRLEDDVERFQALARGWAIRRWARRVTGGKVGGKEKVRRVRGGW
ncbi:calmodulin-binding protein-like protein Sha1 [Lophiostoma macrostomum CBS 122681]|uniref:Calmodulin-binding protein-like protein Sha1 n=1 Tax=Lophiostoma macrostomum CBS 122681 TaxID=1314788 RepID=A0A6A6TLI9_9PLEO|nr:calmodulin-binding protein-like protein Sha1 [Lophiostoma macrostomum CBS 122681]